MADTRNPFLSAIGARLRRDRQPFSPGTNVTVISETVDGSPFIRVWFRTAGCTYDRQGLCTMCNYGAGEGIPRTIAQEVREALAGARLDVCSTLLVSPSGSMFDPREVPDDLRGEVLAAVADTQVGTVVCETRPETVTDSRMEEFADAIAPRAGVVELGLESSNPWVLQWCVNKRLDLEQFRRAVEVCHRQGLRVLANVTLGTAFLPPGAAIRDAENAVRWALGVGADACVVFPMHVRDWTVLGWLWRHSLYQPPSLWSLVEILQRVTLDFPGRVSTAWYRDYNVAVAQAAVSMPILASPTTCPLCVERVVGQLDLFRSSGDPTILSDAAESTCPCRVDWLAQIGAEAVDIRAVERAYAHLGEGVMGRRWWFHHGNRVLADLTSSLRPSG